MRPYPALLAGLIAGPACLSLFSARAPAVSVPAASVGTAPPASGSNPNAVPVDGTVQKVEDSGQVPAGAVAPAARDSHPPSTAARAESPAPIVNAGPASPGKTPESGSVITTPAAAPAPERMTLPVCTIYTDDLPAGVIRTERRIRTEVRGGQTLITTEVTRYERPYHPLPESWIVIPSLGLRYRLVEGVSQRAMSHGPGHFPGMALPGEIGNCGIAAHSNVPGCDYFHSLHRLRPGSVIYVETPDDTFRYVVTNLHVVRPSNTSDLLPTPYRRLTLVTCTLPDARNRLIVEAISYVAGQESLGGTVPTRFRMPEAGNPSRRRSMRRNARTASGPVRHHAGRQSGR